MKDRTNKIYSYGFLLPAGLIYGGLFIVPTFLSFFFSLTRWTLIDWNFIGLDNFKTFFSEPSLTIGFKNSIIYAILTCGFKVVLGFLLATLLCSKIRTRGFLRSIVFFPTIISTIAVGITFSSMMQPSTGIINKSLALVHIAGPDWLGNLNLALVSVILVDVWKGVGMATVIFIAGIMSIPEQYYEAIMVDGANVFQKFRYITLPLSRSAMNSVIILAFIGGIRSFDLIWTMTGGGPGFTTDVIASIIYKQYISGFYGIATAGNVILFVVVSLLAFPLYKFLTKSEVDM
jgi:raffinose/stachyose/melibiose transport system permease protein